MVYSHIIGKWVTIAEVSEIRTMIAKLDEEEDQAAITAAVKVETEQMIFVADDEDNIHRSEFVKYCDKMAELQAIEEAKMSNSKSDSSSNQKKTFTADDGKKYVWDAEEDDWVESGGGDGDSAAEDDDEDIQDANEEAEEEDCVDGHDKSNMTTSQASTNPEKAKRKRKNKSRSKSNKGWVYITGNLFAVFKFTE